MLLLEDILKLKKEDLINASDNARRAVVSIQRKYYEIINLLDRVNNKYKLEYYCKYCGCKITIDNRYLWNICLSCKKIYHNGYNNKTIYKYKKERNEISCDNNCLECKYDDCVKKY